MCNIKISNTLNFSLIAIFYNLSYQMKIIDFFKVANIMVHVHGDCISGLLQF